ncbi:NUDIX domain-containing protein [Hyphococcus sp.]|uniref:NUDIX domain-containing protein n=1 Tax=Hyphococcus sp. TaxID=2038636 RepID=UPI003CCBF4B0
MTTHEVSIGPWRIEAKRDVFENPWVKIVDHDVTHPDGSTGAYGVVRFKNIAVGVLPIDAAGRVSLVGQHRFPLDRYSWELPEGGGHLDIDPLESAKRELAEETGFTAASWAPLSVFDISNSVTDERAACYLAWDLTEGAASPDPSEALTVKWVSYRDLLEMVITGEITDSLTIVMALMAQAKALRGEFPEPICSRLLAAATRK